MLYIWYTARYGEEGPGRAWAACGPPSPLLAVPNVTTRPSQSVYQVHIMRCGNINCGAKKLHPFYFCNNFVKPHYISIIFGTADTEINLQQNWNEITRLSWCLLSPYLVKLNISRFFHNGSNVRFKRHDTEKHYSKINVQCLLLALRYVLKQACYWSIAWSMKLCWLLTTF